MKFSTAIVFTILSLIQTRAFAFEVCSPENDFLENLLPQIQANDPAVLPQICVEAANLSLPVKGFYGFCPDPTGQPARTHRRPCVSEKYVNAIYSSLTDVTDCFGYDARLAFATFNLESALHLTAVGAATDVGVGQLTKSAIDEVNLNALARAKRFASSSPRPSCARILPDLTEHSSAISERCGFMHLPDNPNRNVAYSILLLQQSRKVIETLWKRNNISLPATVNTERLKALMTMLSYNSGPGGISATLKAYVTQMGANITDHHFNFESADEDAFVKYILDNFPSTDAAVRKRISKYIGHVIAAVRRADTLAQGQGACVHPDYFTPTFQPAQASGGKAPSFLRAQVLVKNGMRELALDIAKNRNHLACDHLRHNFLFTFLAQGQRAEDLPYDLLNIYSGLCH